MTARRLLEDLIGELAEGIPVAGDVHATAVEFSLPVETKLAPGRDGLRVHADLPRTRTRTDFDLPVSRLALNLVTCPTGGGA
jgi:hypothetical protein